MNRLRTLLLGPETIRDHLEGLLICYLFKRSNPTDRYIRSVFLGIGEDAATIARRILDIAFQVGYLDSESLNVRTGESSILPTSGTLLSGFWLTLP